MKKNRSISWRKNLWGWSQQKDVVARVADFGPLQRLNGKVTLFFLVKEESESSGRERAVTLREDRLGTWNPQIGDQVIFRSRIFYFLGLPVWSGREISRR